MMMTKPGALVLGDQRPTTAATSGVAAPHAAPAYEAPRVLEVGRTADLVQGGGGMSGSDRNYYYYYLPGE
ncbi:MAG: hypothetical protein KIT36_02235 [Alphaproteobacteria bacterium]|nr:hypothetical protein [Alphaproteobacteria bacterium]